VRVLEALKILEDATLDCKIRDINTPEVRTALEVLQPYCRPLWRVTGFHDHLKQHGEQGPDSEGQQQVLRVYFGGIYENVRQLLSTQVKKLSYRYEKTKDVSVKRELNRLKSKLEQLPERWDFRPR
jgi:hypothetical protein